MATLALEELNVFCLSEALADAVWDAVVKWRGLAKSTIGEQLVCAADSVGANIAEGFGRGSYKDNCRFIKIARGSLYETRYWLRRAQRRKLLEASTIETLRPLMVELAPVLNGYLRSVNNRSKQKQTTNNKQQRTKDNNV